jgi:hypothetical protein
MVMPLFRFKLSTKLLSPIKVGALTNPFIINKFVYRPISHLYCLEIVDYR